MLKKITLIFFLYLISIDIFFTQPVKNYNAAVTEFAIEKFTGPGRPFYINALPGYENTSLISNFLIEKQLKTVYLLVPPVDERQNQNEELSSFKPGSAGIPVRIKLFVNLASWGS